MDNNVPNESHTQELFSFCVKNLANYKVLGIIEFLEELPKTISGKILRIERRAEEAQNRIEKKSIDQEYFHSKY